MASTPIHISYLHRRLAIDVLDRSLRDSADVAFRAINLAVSNSGAQESRHGLVDKGLAISALTDVAQLLIDSKLVVVTNNSAIIVTPPDVDEGQRIGYRVLEKLLENKQINHVVLAGLADRLRTSPGEYEMVFPQELAGYGSPGQSAVARPPLGPFPPRPAASAGSTPPLPDLGGLDLSEGVKVARKTVAPGLVKSLRAPFSPANVRDAVNVFPSYKRAAAQTAFDLINETFVKARARKVPRTKATEALQVVATFLADCRYVELSDGKPRVVNLGGMPGEDKNVENGLAQLNALLGNQEVARVVTAKLKHRVNEATDQLQAAASGPLRVPPYDSTAAHSDVGGPSPAAALGRVIGTLWGTQPDRPHYLDIPAERGPISGLDLSRGVEAALGAPAPSGNPFDIG